jgi:integrase
VKLLDQIRHTARVKHFSIRTERAYVNWAERYIRFHGIKHPNTMGVLEVEAFLTHLAVEGNVAASTQNQALAALLFLYQEVLKIDIGRLDAVRARRPVRVPLVLSQPEVGQLLITLDEMPTTEPYALMARLMYGAGMRLMECCRLRMKDIDLERGQLTIRGGKGDRRRQRGCARRWMGWEREPVNVGWDAIRPTAALAIRRLFEHGVPANLASNLVTISSHGSHGSWISFAACVGETMR